MDFDEIYRQYFRDVYLFVLAICEDPDIAEEVTQETFFKALKGIRTFKGDCTLKTWLCRIGRNTCFTYLKKRRRFSGSDALEPDGRKPPPDLVNEEDGEVICVRKDEALSIYKVLHHLDEPYREVFTLRTLGELSFREIGEIFGCKEGWARVTYHRAKLKIQEMIREV